MTSQLTPELMSWVGKSMPPVTEKVSRRDIRHYSIATDQRLEKYLRGDEAPPMFYQRFFVEIATLDRLQDDGHVEDPIVPDLPLKRVMAGGCETVFHRPIRPEENLTATRTVVEMYERQGRTGPLIFVVIELKIDGEDGKPVVVERYTRIAR